MFRKLTLHKKKKDITDPHSHSASSPELIRQPSSTHPPVTSPPIPNGTGLAVQEISKSDPPVTEASKPPPPPSTATSTNVVQDNSSQSVLEKGLRGTSTYAMMPVSW